MKCAADEHAWQMAAVLDAEAVEQVDQVLSGQVAGRPRRVRAAAGPPGRGVEAGDAVLQARHHVGQSRAPGVMEVVGDALERDPGRQRSAGQLVDLGWDPDADGVAETDLVDAEIEERQADVDRPSRFDAPAVRAAEGRRDVATPPPTDLLSPVGGAGANVSSDSDTVMPMLWAVKASLAAVKTAIAVAPAAAARSKPLLIGDRTG